VSVPKLLLLEHLHISSASLSGLLRADPMHWKAWCWL